MNRVLGAYWVFGLEAHQLAIKKTAITEPNETTNNDEQPFKSIWHIEGTVMIRSEGEYPMPDWL